MTSVAGIVAPIFALIILGAAARHWRKIDLPGLRALNDLTFYLAIPALLFGSVVETPSLQVLDVAGCSLPPASSCSRPACCWPGASSAPGWRRPACLA